MKRGRPPLDAEVAVKIWALIECAREGGAKSVRAASIRVARELHRHGNVTLSAERLRKLWELADIRRQTDPVDRRAAIEQLARCNVLRRHHGWPGALAALFSPDRPTE